MARFPWKKWVATYSVALLVGIYTALVAQSFWNWLGVPLFHIPSISFIQACCLMLLVALFTRSGFPIKLKGDVGYLKSVELALGFCIPEEKQELWKEHCNDHTSELLEAFGAIVGALATNTLLLTLGFVLHLAITA